MGQASIIRWEGDNEIRRHASAAYMAYIAAIGKLFGDGGLWTLLTATGVYAEATARQMLQGKQYDRGVRGIRS